MSINITDSDLERRLEELGKRQRIPVRKSAMARAILRAAVGDDRGKPVNKWGPRARDFAHGNNEPNAA